MQLTGDALAFIHSFRKALLKLARDAADAEPSHPSQQGGRGKHRQPHEPPALIESRFDNQAKTGSSLIPYPIVVARDHAKAIVPRWQVGVERLPPGAGVLPI